MKNFFDHNLKSLAVITLSTLIFYLFTQSFIGIADVKIRAKSVNPTNTITFKGTAEIEAKPDVATFTITVRENAPNIASAQQKMTEKSNKLLALFDQKSIAKKDIQTANYSTNPRYNFENVECHKHFCPQPKQVLQDYEATQSFTLKLRDVAKSGEILSAIAGLEIDEVNGPIFAIEDPAKLKSEAQAQAILKAKAEAKMTAKNLGVKLRKIIRFSAEPTRHFPRPMMASRTAVSNLATESVQIEAGENKVTSTVFLTYEIE